MSPQHYGKVVCLLGNIYTSRLPNLTLKRINSVNLAPATFDLFSQWMRHGTSKSVYNCRNKKNCNKCSKIVRKPSSSWMYCVDSWFLQFIKVCSVHEVHRADCFGTLRANIKNVPPVVTNNKSKKGEPCGQHRKCGSSCVVRQEVSDYDTYIHTTKMKCVWL
jgi:hypothetical protein